jgi:hypothetical protein
LVHTTGSLLAHSVGSGIPLAHPVACPAAFSIDRLDAGVGVQIYWCNPYAAIPNRTIAVVALKNRFSLIYLQFNKTFAA